MGRSRRWLRYVLAALVAALVVLSCAASFDPASKINKLRVLGVTADRPSARAGEQVTLRMTVTDGLRPPSDPAAGPRALQLLWLGGCFNPQGDSWFFCFEQLAEQFAALGGGGLPPEGLVKVDLASAEDDGQPDLHEFTLTLPDDIVSSRPPPTAGPHYGIAIVFFAACAGTMQPTSLDSLGPIGQGDLITLPLQCLDAAGQPQGADSFVVGYTQIYAFADERDNANPAIDGMTFDEVDMPETADEVPVVPACPVSEADRRQSSCTSAGLEECESYTLKALIGDVAEIDPDGTDLEGNPLREIVWVNYFADGGDFDSSLALVSGAKEGYLGRHDVEWYPPDEPGLVSIWAVARDQRGGSSVIRRLVRIE